MKINKVFPDKHMYLQPVCEIAKPPHHLYVAGTLPEQRTPTIAIIGTRKPTSYGREITATLSQNLAKKGIIVVSGLALGTDGIAQLAAVESGGVSIGILGNPLPDIRPATNRHIAEKILKSGGAIISEYGPDDDYTVGKWSFLERNRLVAGLSDAILITEASTKSGTLNTAARALEQGKEVFVVPGNITSPASAGCNLLLRQGATPVTRAEDIIEVLLPEAVSTQVSLPLGGTPLESDVIALLSSGTRDGDEIRSQLGVSAAELNVALTMLEIAGTIRSIGGNQWMLR